MKRAFFGYFPGPKITYRETALLALTDLSKSKMDKTFEMFVLFSQQQAVRLANSLNPNDQKNLHQLAKNSALPPSSKRCMVKIPPPTTARILAIYQTYIDHQGENIQVRHNVPLILALDPTTHAQIQTDKHVCRIPDFMVSALAPSGAPELIIGFSQAQAREYLAQRQHWNITQKALIQFNSAIQGSALPEHSFMQVISIPGAAAWIVCKMLVIQYYFQKMGN